MLHWSWYTGTQLKSHNYCIVWYTSKSIIKSHKVHKALEHTVLYYNSIHEIPLLTMQLQDRGIYMNAYLANTKKTWKKKI